MEREEKTAVSQPQTKEQLESWNSEEAGIFLYGLQRDRGPANTLMLDFWPPTMRLLL